MKLTNNFTAEEFECSHCGELYYDQEFLNRLQIVRERADFRFTVTRGYSCKEHNDSIPNASKKSRHLSGAAADILTQSWDSYSLWLVVTFALEQRLSIGLYRKHIHLDLRHGDPVLFWGNY